MASALFDYSGLKWNCQDVYSGKKRATMTWSGGGVPLQVLYKGQMMNAKQKALNWLVGIGAVVLLVAVVSAGLRAVQGGGQGPAAYPGPETGATDQHRFFLLPPRPRLLPRRLLHPPGIHRCRR
jgi:hypothetical protein